MKPIFHIREDGKPVGERAKASARGRGWEGDREPNPRNWITLPSWLSLGRGESLFPVRIPTVNVYQMPS
ncbi:MAG: hypothetical protein JWP89_2583 [Schlesneria sp.]|nr:hypothetical protein [Schlesneria sp.]